MKSIVFVDVEKQPDFVTDHYYVTSKTEPLGLLYLEAFLSNHGVPVYIAKVPLNFHDWQKITNADIVGLSGLTYCWRQMKELTKEIRIRNPKAFIVAGREHASLSPVSVLNNDDFDAVIVGEGEYPLLALCQGKDLKDIPSLVYRDRHGNILKNSISLSLKKEELFPLKRRRHWMKNMLHESISEYSEMAGIMLSRGCVFKCNFCTAEGMWKGYRDMGVMHALDEIQRIINSYGVRYFAFHDLMLNTSHKLIYAFCDEIIRRKIKANFFAMMSVIANNLDFTYLNVAGFNEIGIGIEIPSDKRKDIGKRLSFKKTVAFIKRISDAGIFVRGYLILGWPWETSKKELVEEYSNALKLLPINALRVNFLTPFPGTGIYESYKNFCIYQPIEDAYDHFTTMEPVLKFKLSPIELEEARIEIIQNYYSSKEYLLLNLKQKKIPTLKNMNESFYAHYEKVFLKKLDALDTLSDLALENFERSLQSQ